VKFRASFELTRVTTYDFDLHYRMLFGHTWNTGYLSCFMSTDMPDSRLNTVILTYIIVYRLKYYRISFKNYRISFKILWFIWVTTYDFDLHYRILCRRTWNTGYLSCFMSIDMPDNRLDAVIFKYIIVYHVNYYLLTRTISTCIIVHYIDIREIPDICRVSCRLTCLTAD